MGHIEPLLGRHVGSKLRFLQPIGEKPRPSPCHAHIQSHTFSFDTYMFYLYVLRFCFDIFRSNGDCRVQRDGRVAKLG